MSDRRPEPSPPGELTALQRKHLKALAHHLDPTVRVGRSGASDAVVREAAKTLDAHELVKVRIDDEDGSTRRELAAELAGATGAHVVGTIGKIAILYRRNDEKPKIKIPSRS